jgi:hypothetical protein
MKHTVFARPAQARKVLASLGSLGLLVSLACGGGSGADGTAAGGSSAGGSEAGGTGGSVGAGGELSGSGGQVSGSGGGGMWMGATCPPDPPAHGTACPLAGFTCTYGDDPRGPRCRERAVCEESGWAVETPVCAALTEPLCPADADPMRGEACQQALAICDVGDARCVCSNCREEVLTLCEGGVCDEVVDFSCDTETLQWICRTHASSNCPQNPRNLGGVCEIGADCRYLDAECENNFVTRCDAYRVVSSTGFGSCE